MAERWVVLALGTPRSVWFRELPRLATAGALPIDVIPCISRSEAERRLDSGRAHSALIVEASSREVDRDLIDRCHRVSVAVLVIDDREGRDGRDVRALGADVVLPVGFGRQELLDALDATATRRGEAATASGVGPLALVRTTGRLVAVTGSGGTGTSTLAAVLAQGLAGRGEEVVLADLCLDAEQAMLHGSPDVVPGLPELVDAHRMGWPSDTEIRSLCYDVSGRGYHLLLGLRRHRDWAALRPRALVAAVTGLRQSFDVVVADVDADAEGEASTGSSEVEERNVLARTILSQADAVVICTVATMKGVHAMVRMIDSLATAGVPVAAMVPVLNHAPRTPRSRLELSGAVARLAAASIGRTSELRPVVMVPTRKTIEMVHRDAVAFPAAFVEPLTAAVAAIARVGSETQIPAVSGRRLEVEPELVRPGSLGVLGESA